MSFLIFNENGCGRLTSWTDQTLKCLNDSFQNAGKLISKKQSNADSKQNTNDKLTTLTIEECLNQLAVLSLLQWELYKKKKEIKNKCRLIVITNFQNNNQVNSFIKSLNASLIAFNKSIDLNDEFSERSKLPISELHLVLINVYPINQDNYKINEIHNELRNENCLLNYELLNCKSGTFIASKMITLLINHYDLASTTVTNIPMKEEQNASSSANYDVEIVHSNQAHLDLFKNCLVPADQLNLRTKREDETYETISLKWCTPKGSSVELHQCTGAYRITAVEINSRPSSCLINFLLSGRTVMLMLDVARLKGKCMSHMLSSHCGELFIHTLSINKSIIDDPPSVSEGIGGRVSDYRINDFGDLMKLMRLEKCKPSTSGEQPLEKARQVLTKQTLYWPLTIGHSIIFNLPNQIQPLLTLIPKDSLTIDEINDCQNCIYQLVAMENNKNSPLPVPVSVLPKSKHMKKEELYKLMWKELEYFIERHAITPEHNKVLSCLKELNSKFDTSKENGLANQTNASAKKFSMNLDENELAWKEFDRYNSMTEKEKTDLDMPDLKRPKLNVSDNSMSKAILKKSMMNGSLSLYSLNAQRLELENTRKLKEFKGRQSGSNIAQLYTSLTESNQLKPENPL